MIPSKRSYPLVLALQGTVTMIAAFKSRSWHPAKILSIVAGEACVRRIHNAPPGYAFSGPLKLCSSKLPFIRWCQKQSQTFETTGDAARLFGSSSTSDTTNSNTAGTIIPKEHLKSYHIQGASTTPVAHSPTPSISSISNEGSSSRTSTKKRSSRGCGPGVTMTTNTRHTLRTDVPKLMGGMDAAPQPVETLLAALIGCTQATAMFVGRQLQPRVIIDKMEFDLMAFRDERGALALPIERDPAVVSRLQEVAGIVKVFASMETAAILTKEHLELLKEQTELRCPVANMMLASGCQMNVEWINSSGENVDG